MIKNIQLTKIEKVECLLNKYSCDGDELEMIDTNLARSLYSKLDQIATDDSLCCDIAYALLAKKTNRYFINKENKLKNDNLSIKWSPKFYKMWNGIEVLKEHLSGKNILDPFAGSGIFSYYLLSSGIANKLTLNDISYPFNECIMGTGNYYEPRLNIEKLCLNSKGFIPNKLDNITFTNHDARKLPKDLLYDYVFSDPPFLRNFKNGGLHFLVETIPSLFEVVTKGLIFLIPMEWEDLLAAEYPNSLKITGDLSNGLSNHPMSYILIKK